MWSMTSNPGELRNGSFQPSTRGTKMRCALELMGMNSVSPWISPMRAAWTSSAIPALPDEERRHHQGDGREQLHEDVERRAGGVLERIANGIAHDRGGVGRRLLADHVAGVIGQVAGLDVLLGVVPRAATVVEHCRQHDASDGADHEQARDRLVAEDQPD